MNLSSTLPNGERERRHPTCHPGCGAEARFIRKRRTSRSLFPMFTLTVVLLVPRAAQPQQIEWPRFVNAVAHAETGNNHRAVGAKGERGAWQFREATWEEISRRRRAVFTEFWSFRYGAHQPVHARIYASQWLSLLARELHCRMGRPPTCADIYAAYNMGLTGYARCGYNPARTPKVTQQGIQRLEEYLTKP